MNPSQNFSKPSRRKALALLGLAATLTYAAPLLTPLGEAQASGALNFYITDKATKKECGECHMVYDAGLMPKESWRRLMNDLSNHFGENAALDEPTRAHIEQYLVSHALKGDGPLRITEQTWFKREHRGGKPAASLANCNRCHLGG
jgi:hypothetical protein